MGCKLCGLSYESKVPHCLKCSKALNEAGLCSWCGKRQRKPKAENGQQSKYCHECQTARVREYDTPTAVHGNYRSAEKRENIRETKFGRDG